MEALDEHDNLLWMDDRRGHDEHEHFVEASSEEEFNDMKDSSRLGGMGNHSTVQLELQASPQEGEELHPSVVADEERGTLLLCADFNATCSFSARLGAAAMNNGSIAENIERFLPKLMAVYGYYGFFSCSTFELSCNFEKQDRNETIVRTQNVAIEAGDFQLTKLGLLSDLAKDLMDCKIDIKEAGKLLDEIEGAPNPWGVVPMTLSFMITGATLPAVLGGSWWDMLLGPFAGAIAYGLVLLFHAWPSRVHIWLNLAVAFLCSTLGFGVQLLKADVDPTIVTLSGVAYLLPSSTITLGINDLVSSHVISGLERLVKGMVIMMWLALGFVLGLSFVGFVADTKSGWTVTVGEAEINASQPIPALWQLLFIPILSSSIAVCFQMTGKDMIGAVVCIVLGYSTSYVGVLIFNKPYIGSFMGSLAISTYANVWSRYYDRPNTIILFPAFQLVVAGIVGFMGLTQIVQGSTEDGGKQVLHMLTVAGVVVIGFLVSGTVVHPFSTI